ncbi:acetate/propionate family kinase [Anaerococcus hydrogenalis]|uniref:Acetate kinase n=1 Tax=Anaerococcus hydrogenalis TaxID=33029 RepID=A0A2N6UKH4_9FIRM|nr:acetate kinase [Anaerococcus hydrogenalis]MBS5989476.1 acetate kinase [Anaerococcus hydrogenalis]MDK7694311.1 acetate kinase [Anaerococcus hydrogenalis]MDK7696089.1 acetate kinase [Anaerococcus hydrogenalis]MDK7707338.1 acetate kinase [Anaerococcus hydrogenalis]PMC82361.1 acetate kinase [Anaerococcus hydrogenalis]
MKILVINCGSSSLKYQLFDMDNEEVLVKGLVERIGIDGSRLKQEKGEDEYIIEEDMKDHTEAVKHVFDAITDKENGVISDLSEIDAVGHRFVHGGEKITKSVVIDENVREAVKEYSKFAPLHNPANMMGLEACEKLLPNVKNVAVFDTAFHQSMPEENFLYGIDYKYYEDQAVRKYGFHGTSHDFITQKTAQVLEKDQKDLNMISCHLGNGSSICAIKEGKSFDTTMGLTPLEGLVMGTRSGDLDPTVVTFLMNEYGYDTKKMDNVLNKESGVLGVSGVSSDFRDLENAANDGNKRADIALKMFANRAKRYIAGYMAEVGNVEAIVFTGGIGENSITMRESIMEGFEQFGIKIDPEKNNVRGGCHLVSTDDSKVKVFVIATNEELMIARDTKKLV